MADLRPLRLQALRAHPEAFGISFEEEQAEDTGRLIAEPPGMMLGGFVAGRLVGCAAVLVPSRIKQRHKGHVVSVYVASDSRRTGLARALMEALIRHARCIGLLSLTLSVTVGNESARQLYLRAGFRSCGVEPASLRIGADLFDEELMVLTLSNPAADADAPRDHPY